MGKYPIRDFCESYLMALCGRPIQWPSREPVAYLYNGVRLPKLPVVEGMEFAFIYTLANLTNVVFSDSYDLGISRETLMQQVEVPDGNVSYGYNPERGGWVQFSSTSARNIAFDYIKWANFDIINENGTTYLAASAPVPVYE